MGLFSSLFGTDGSAKRAAGVAAQGYQDASQTEGAAQTGINAAYAPYQAAGTTALGQYSAAMNGDYSGFNNSPGYQFAMQQGVNAIDRSAASKGSLFSGGTGRALTNYGQGLAGNQYQSYLSNLMGMIGVGQNATNSVSQSQFNTAAEQGQNNIGANAAEASGITGKANEMSNATNSLISIGAGIAGGIAGGPAGAAAASSMAPQAASSNPYSGPGGGVSSYSTPPPGWGTQGRTISNMPWQNQ